MTILDIKQEFYFPFNFKVFGGIVILGDLLISPSLIYADWALLKALCALGAILLGLILITARYGLRIDIKNKSYKVYVKILGYESGTQATFNFIDKFYINEVKETVRTVTRSGAKFDSSELLFKAYMRLDNGEKVHLDTDKDKSSLDHRLVDYKLFLVAVYQEETL